MSAADAASNQCKCYIGEDSLGLSWKNHLRVKQRTIQPSNKANYEVDWDSKRAFSYFTVMMICLRYGLLLDNNPTDTKKICQFANQQHFCVDEQQLYCSGISHTHFPPCALAMSSHAGLMPLLKKCTLDPFGNRSSGRLFQ